ncbi:hypothetical protein [Clostridium botulinum]|uniref:hypothetical protein n=1 Tax=Clostridium botulinum TaxID=1491 RepID=UPI000772DCBB|nr:hypothetical protein [Clostridium botulinum]NFL40093.1 hypothetical protein [Clostridium botulinum]NFL67172.1 hypothetical protein [Clostridium botulinum]NFN09968.1 hypothetical protein [Clostridium botulinum]NFN33486.1 hypothetical protein [Clostridium botulinum]
MGYLKNHKNSNIFKEFNIEQQEKYFYLTEKKYMPHVDTFYYSIFIKGDTVNSSQKDNISFPQGIYKMLDFLQFAKSEISDTDKSIWFDYDKDLLIYKKRFSIYDYCISKQGFYDIFITKSLPNDSTPRIVIQLRSIGLWGLGEYELIKETYNVVKDFLQEYNLEIIKVQENRIDFCYHTNSLQSPKKFYDDKCLADNCRTNMGIFNKVGRKIQKKLEFEYLSFGSRRSNCIFFRSYNKAREVVEENYKDFFLELWYNAKIINFYDFYVYSYAYKKKSYYQIYEGMAQFYLEFGNDEDFKLMLKFLLERKHTLEEVKNLILLKCPLPTQVVNIEFQTMRKFYLSVTDIFKLPIFNECEFNLLRLFQILDNRKYFLDYLTDVTISFRKSDSDEYMDFWNRLRNCKFKQNFDMKLKRDYSKNINRDIIISKIKSNLATLSLYDEKWDTDINDDMSYLLCILNDNDMRVDSLDGTIFYEDYQYKNIKEKKKKALKSLLNKPKRPSQND